MIKVAISFIVVLTVSITLGSPLPDYPFVFADGQAKEAIHPDICKISFSITVRDKNTTNCLKQVKARSLEALSFLAKHGIPKEQIVGHEIDKDVIKNYDSQDKLHFLGYEMSRHIEFTLKTLEKYEALMSEFMKITDLVDIESNFDRTDRMEIESRLLSKAVENARSKAELIAKGANQKIVRLRAISQSGFYNFAERFGLGNVEYNHRMYSMSDSSDNELLFVPSVIEFRNSINVVYEVTEDK